MSNRNSDENKNRIHINDICPRLFASSIISSRFQSVAPDDWCLSSISDAAHWIKCTRWDCMATWGQPLKCSWAGFKNRPVYGFSGHRKPTGGRLGVWGGFANWWRLRGKLPSKIAYLLWQTSQVSRSAAGRKKCSRCFNGEEAGRRGARSSFPSFFWQHLWRNIAFSFEHFEQKKIERDPEDEKRRHPLKFQTLSGLNMSIIFFQIRFHWTEPLSSLPTKIYFSHGSTFFFSCICPLGLCISNMLQKILIFLWIHVKNLLYLSFGCGVSYLCFICLFVI